jgi:hypothetical protein
MPVGQAEQVASANGRRLRALEIMAHSPRTWANPRSRNCRTLLACWIGPKTGSTTCLLGRSRLRRPARFRRAAMARTGSTRWQSRHRPRPHAASDRDERGPHRRRSRRRGPESVRASAIAVEQERHHRTGMVGRVAALLGMGVADGREVEGFSPRVALEMRPRPRRHELNAATAAEAGPDRHSTPEASWPWAQ